MSNEFTKLRFSLLNFRYDFNPPIKYNFLNEEEAEAQFEKRNKTLNYFSVMVSKRLRDQEGEWDNKTSSLDKEARGSKKKSQSSGGLVHKLF